MALYDSHRVEYNIRRDSGVSKGSQAYEMYLL